MRFIRAALAVFVLGLGASHAVAKETFVQAPGPKGPLEGTLLSPGDKVPIVLLIPGSGNVDRDGDAGPPVKAANLKLLAEGLNARGVATVRVDKRGMYASTAAGDANSATIEDMGQDVHAWTHALVTQLGAPCIWVAGHSEGGAVAIAAAQDPEEICGLILLSTFGRPLSEVVREQVHASGAGPLVAASDTILDKLERGEHVPANEIPGPLIGLYAPQVQDKLIADFRFRPPEKLANFHGPVMIVQGANDLQVSLEDAARLRAARPDARFLVIAGMTHMWKIAPTDRLANISSYADPSLPLAPGLADAVATFVNSEGEP